MYSYSLSGDLYNKHNVTTNFKEKHETLLYCPLKTKAVFILYRV